jgi:hypothetical protein
MTIVAIIAVVVILALHLIQAVQVLHPLLMVIKMAVNEHFEAFWQEVLDVTNVHDTIVLGDFDKAEALAHWTDGVRDPYSIYLTLAH